jgi:2'-5' RNA ligase
MGSPEARLRLFVAVYPPVEVAARLLELLGRVELARHRVTPVEQVHLTVQFVGPTPVRDLDEVKESVARSVSGIATFELRVVRLMSVPPRGRVRLVAAELDQPWGLMEIQRRLATRLARHVRERAGDRFLPHMTLCRFDREGASRDVDVAVEEELPFGVREVRLMKSVLKPQGAEHGLVMAFGLGDT